MITALICYHTAMKYPHTVIENDSTRAEWTELRDKLGALTESQVEQIATRIGLTFAKSTKATKNNFIDILDEAYWDEMAEAYLVVVGSTIDIDHQVTQSVEG